MNLDWANCPICAEGLSFTHGDTRDKAVVRKIIRAHLVDDHRVSRTEAAQLAAGMFARAPARAVVH